MSPAKDGSCCSCDCHSSSQSSSVRSVTLLGATGSIGDATCDLLRLHKDKYKVHALAASSNAAKMFDLTAEFEPERVAMSDEHSAEQLRKMLEERRPDLAARTDVLAGESGVIEVSGDGGADTLVGAIVGAAGLKPLLAAIKTGCRICLANKEALVMSGQLFFDMARTHKALVLPVDSEHSAIFQCLPASEQVRMGSCDLASTGVSEILLTGSGGPFRDCELSALKDVTPAMAINHPVWSMGPKISVDSATMMNKALEYIEARYLFNASVDQVKVIVHPQSVIHSMVSYVDGAVMAQLGQPDMKTPIAHAMAWPQRMDAGVKALDFTSVGSLTFREPDRDRYPCLFMGMEASTSGQAMTTALNAANEVAVASFLSGRLSFTGISETVDHVLNSISGSSAYELEEILAVDSQARRLAESFVASRS